MQHSVAAVLLTGDRERDSLHDWLRAFEWTCPLVVAGPGSVGVLA